MATKKEIVEQVGKLTGRVMYANCSDVKKTQSGKSYLDYNFAMRLNNGASIFVSDKVWNVEDEANMSDFTRATMEKYDYIVDNYKEEDIYVSKRVAPTKNKKTKESAMSFDTMKSYVKKDGTVATTLTGRVEPLNHSNILDGDGNVVDVEFTMSGAKGDYKTKFSETKTSLMVKMFLEEAEGNNITVTDGTDDDYKLQLMGVVPEQFGIEKAQLGVAYKFEVFITKGKIERAEEVVDTAPVENVWETEAKETQATFAPDYLTFIPKGKVSGLAKQGNTPKAPQSSTPVRTRAARPAAATNRPF